MQKFCFKILLAVFIISTAFSVQKVLGAEKDQSGKELQSSEDLFNSKLTGDWYGERTKLADNGITLDIDMIQTFQGVLDGGIEKDWKYGGSLDYWLKLDFEKMGLWPGAFIELRAETQFGEFINSDTGSILAVNTDGFFPLPNEHITTLSHVVFTQFLSESFGVYFGKIDTLDGDKNHFAGARGKENFMNQNFVLNPVTLRTAPYSSLGAGAVFFFPDAADKDPATLAISVLGVDGQPDTAGWDDDFENGEVYGVEYSQPTKLFDLPGKQLFGAAYSNKDYTALDQDRRTILSSLLGFGTLSKEEGSWCGYYNFHQYLVTEEDDETQGFGLFGRYGFADDETSPIEAFYSIGLGGKGTFEGRDNDTWGIGYYYIRLSQELPSALNAIVEDPQGFEVFYNIEVSPSVHITPDLQIVNPARSNFSTAVIAGCRVKIDF
ncbi:MAG: carbohydrate porin [Planctomycetota bacterium]|jgi:porin